MLVDVAIDPDPHMALIGRAIAQANGGMQGVKRISQGVYELGHFSMDHMIQCVKEQWPELEEGFNCYGVCDGWRQVVEQCPMLETSDRKFVIGVTLIDKRTQPAEGGWRWHKWGPYIGDHEPQCEYIHDEPEIDRVYVYNVLEVEV